MKEYLFWGIAALVMVAAYVVLYRLMWCGWRGLFDIALEEAAAGDSAGLIRAFDRLRAKVGRKPNTPPLGVLAGSCVFNACEWEHPDTAQALLGHLGLKRAELLWEEKGKPAVPLRAFVQGNPDFARTHAFMQQED